MRSIWPLGRCPRPGRARSSAIGTPARPSFDRRWRNTPVKATSSICRSIKGCSRKSKPRGGGAEAALAGIDGALALAGETGEHWFDAALHRIRGEILLKQNPADPAPAEAAFLAAIAVAQQQKARSFELRAALSLAKLYQSTGRPIDAHDVLGPALARLFADAGVSADRGGAGVRRRDQGGRRTIVTPATAVPSNGSSPPKPEVQTDPPPG